MSVRQEIIDTALAMNANGLNRGRSGNVSARGEQEFFITPSGRDYESLTPSDIVAMDFDGMWRSGSPVPSSEWRFHRDILAQRPEIGAIVHTHPVHSTALAVHNRGIPAFHYMVAMAGGSDIRCSAYATFGTQALSDAVLNALEGRQACLMAHHGMIACGPDLDAALRLAVEVELLAAQYLNALQLGEPPHLDEEEMARVLAKFQAGYGYASGPDTD
ncbi:MAG: class II aldolase/adducin family protein [Pseudomonadota bacterium]